jgi:osmoprotectant transport system permease protein
VIAGTRTAAVEVVASATLAAFIGGGGLGDFIVDGLATDDVGELLLGAIAVAALALAVDAVLGRLGRRFSPRGIA